MHISAIKRATDTCNTCAKNKPFPPLSSKEFNTRHVEWLSQFYSTYEFLKQSQAVKRFFNGYTKSKSLIHTKLSLI